MDLAYLGKKTNKLGSGSRFHSGTSVACFASASESESECCIEALSNSVARKKKWKNVMIEGDDLPFSWSSTSNSAVWIVDIVNPPFFPYAQT